MAATQMNTRIDSGLKAQGDAALAELGYSPSEAVRLMWGFAARNRHNRSALTDMIDRLKGKAGEKGAAAERTTPVSWALEGPAIISQCIRDMGLGLPSAKLQSCEALDEELADILEEDATRIRQEADATLGLRAGE